MKYLITVCLLSLLITNTYAQAKQNPKKDFSMTDEELSKHYKSKSKQQNIMGTILIAGGVTVGILSMTRANSYEGLIAGEIIGALSIAGGIGLLIAGSKNKGRAKILVRNNSVPVSYDPGKNIPVRSVGIGIRIGRK